MTAPAAPAPRGYGLLLRTPGALAFTLAGLVGRLPIAMLGIGTVLLVQDRRSSYALAGLVGAASALGLAVVGPAVSRLVDRRGQRRVLAPALALSALGVVGVVLAARPGTPLVVLLGAATLMSTAPSQLGSCTRARWSHVLRERPAEVPRAYAWESVVDEVVFVLGPLVVVLCARVDPALGMALALVLGTAGTLAFAAQQRTEPPVHALPSGHRSAMAAPGLRVLTASMLCVGLLFGTLEVAMVAFAQERGSAAGAGFLLALVAAGSGLAALAYGALHLTSPLARRYRLSLLFLAVGLVPVLLAPSVGLMAPAALLAGFAVSPTLICSFGLVDELVPVAARTEGFSWLNAGLGVGVALGFAASGGVADRAGGRAALLVALGAALAAGGVALLGRRALASCGRS